MIFALLGLLSGVVIASLGWFLYSRRRLDAVRVAVIQRLLDAGKQEAAYYLVHVDPEIAVAVRRAVVHGIVGLAIWREEQARARRRG